MTYFAITPNNIVDIPVGFAARLNVAFLAVGRETPFLRAFFLGIMTEGFYGPYGKSAVGCRGCGDSLWKIHHSCLTPGTECPFVFVIYNVPPRHLTASALIYFSQQTKLLHPFKYMQIHETMLCPDA